MPSNAGPDPERAIREVVARAVSDPGLADGRDRRACTRGTQGRSIAPTALTILNVIWGPRMTIMPHNHNMWAVIGVYTGREDNIFWRRLETDGRPA